MPEISQMVVGAGLLFAAFAAGFALGRQLERQHAREVWSAKDGIPPYAKPRRGKPKPGEVEVTK